MLTIIEYYVGQKWVQFYIIIPFIIILVIIAFLILYKATSDAFGLKNKMTVNLQTYDIQYRAYLKMFNGAERSTDIINVTIKARNEADMKKQLQEYVSKNIKVEFAQIRKNES